MKNTTSSTLFIDNFLSQPGSLREVGAIIREYIITEWEDGYDPVIIDFGNKTVASGSIFDEIVKLFEQFPKEEVKRKLKFINIDPADERLIVFLARKRLEKQKTKITK